MSIKWIYNTDRPWDCLGPKGPCNECFDMINLSVNPRHLPAIPIHVGFEMAHESQPYPSSYWWVCSREMLWSCFEKWGFVKERI